MTDRRTTVVTGAGQGIGRSIALAFAEEGDTVVLAARNRANLEATAEMVEAAGGEPIVMETDVTSPESATSTVQSVLEHKGRIDVLVNNSGVGGPSGTLWEVDPDEWRSTFEVNVFGVYHMCRAVMPAMVEQGAGSVIVIGSISGKRPLYGRTSYATTKTALIGLTRTLAVEAGGAGVRVNLISPGFVAGPRIEWVMEAQAMARGITKDDARREFEDLAALGRLTEPEDVARTAVFLASDAAAGITGADINVNSGVVMY